MAEKELVNGFEPLMKILAEAYLNVRVLNKHYVETISQLTGKDKEVIHQELENLIPEQKKKLEELIKKFGEEYRNKNDDLT